MAETKLNTQQLGGNEKVWNETNLVSGKNVKIEKHINPHVITEDTIDVWHFDSSYTGVKGTSISFANDGGFNTTFYKFGSAATVTMRTEYVSNYYAGNGYGVSSTAVTSLKAYDKMSFDMWINFQNGTNPSYPSYTFWSVFNFIDNNPIGIQLVWNWVNKTIVVNDMQKSDNTETLTLDSGNSWHHVAFTYDGSYQEGVAQSVFYFDGVPTLTQTYELSSNFNIRRFNLGSNAWSQFIVDELRLSRGIVYSEDFSDDLPTEAYQEAGSTPDYWELNTAGLVKSTDLSSYATTSALTTGLATKQDVLTAGTGIDITGNTISVTDPTYTRTNLVAGNNVSITAVPQPVIDANTKHLFHFNGSATDVIASSVMSGADVSTSYPGKFDTCALMVDSGNYTVSYFNSFTPDLGDITVDFWTKAPANYFWFLQYGKSSTTTTGDFTLKFDADGSISKYVGYSNPSKIGEVSTTSFHHIAMERETISGTTHIRYYIDGILSSDDTYSSANSWGDVMVIWASSNGTQSAGGGTGGFLDELRISNVARWTSDFTPYNEAYTTTSASKYQINTTVDLSTKQDTLVSGTNIKTVNNTSLLGSGNITIESGSSGPTRTWYKNNTGSTITIADTSSAHSVAIYRNGVLLEPTDDYTISGTTLTLVGDPLTASEKITLEVF